MDLILRMLGRPSFPEKGAGPVIASGVPLPADGCMDAEDAEAEIGAARVWETLTRHVEAVAHQLSNRVHDGVAKFRCNNRQKVKPSVFSLRIDHGRRVLICASDRAPKAGISCSESLMMVKQSRKIGPLNTVGTKVVVGPLNRYEVNNAEVAQKNRWNTIRITLQQH